MRRLLSLILCAASFFAAASDYPGVHANVVPIAVTGKTFYVQGLAGVASVENEGFNSNAGFVVTDEGVVVIDALGTPALGAALLGAIRQVTSKPVRRDGDASFTLGGMRFDVIHLGPAHSPEDLIVAVSQEGVLFSGNILFMGRIPFVGEADSKRWLSTMGR